jgi:MFS family permease
MSDAFLTGISLVALAIAGAVITLELVGPRDRMSDHAKERKRQRTVRLIVWGAVGGMMLSTYITLSAAGAMSVPWRSAAYGLSTSDVRAFGLCVGLPIGAAVGGAVGFALSRRKAR